MASHPLPPRGSCPLARSPLMRRSLGPESGRRSALPRVGRRTPRRWPAIGRGWGARRLRIGRLAAWSQALGRPAPYFFNRPPGTAGSRGLLGSCARARRTVGATGAPSDGRSAARRLGRKDSNLRVADPKSAALPLGYSPAAAPIVASLRRMWSGRASGVRRGVMPARPGRVPCGSSARAGRDLRPGCGPGDAQAHASRPARGGAAAAAAPPDRGEPPQAGQPARTGPVVGDWLGGALIGHGPDHTEAAAACPLRAGAAVATPDLPPPEAGGGPRILRRRWRLHRAR